MSNYDYITPEGHKKLREELTFLLKEERPRVVQGVSDAAAEGDRSENAEYIYGKKRLREIDRRIRFLNDRLEKLTIAEGNRGDEKTIYFGAWVTIVDEEGQKSTYRIVGSDEFDPSKNYISINSPVGLSLLHRKLGDVVSVKRPKGHMDFEITAISYKNG